MAREGLHEAADLLDEATVDHHLRTYLFTTGSVLEIETEAEAGPDTGSGSLGIGSLKGRDS